jgi:excisionase family DNA binding protein
MSCVAFNQTEAATFGSRGAREALAGSEIQLQVAATIQIGSVDRVQPLQAAVAPNRSSLAAPLLQAAVQRCRNKGANGIGSSGEYCLLTVREAADALRVCTATVYSMIVRGELEHVRVSNAIRVVVRAVAVESGFALSSVLRVVRAVIALCSHGSPMGHL